MKKYIYIVYLTLQSGHVYCFFHKHNPNMFFHRNICRAGSWASLVYLHTPLLCAAPKAFLDNITHRPQ